MHPVFLEFGSFRLFSYGAMVAFGGILSSILLRVKWKKMGFRSEDDYWLLVNTILFCGFAGGRVLYLIEYVPLSSPDFWSVTLSFTQGFSVLGALVGIVSGVYLLCRWLKVPFLRVQDYVSLMAPFWHVFGRLGCLAAGCCFGRPSSVPWAVTFTDPRSMVDASLLGVPLHPAQLYEAAGDFGIFAVLYWIVLPRTESGRLTPGTLAGIHFAGYATLRFFMEFIRADVVAMPGLTGGQWLCLVLVAFAGAVLYAANRKPCGPS